MPEHNQQRPPVMLIAIIVIAVLVLGGVAVMMSRSSAKKPAANQNKMENPEVIPPVDSSVEVTVEGVNGNKDLEIVVSNAPEGTSQIDYELSYETAEQGLQGLIGTIQDDEGKFEKKVTLGTCSSGTCVYHKVTGPVKVSLMFSGTYGERLFEKEYTL